MGKWIHTFQALSPTGDAPWPVGVTETKFRRLRENSHLVKLGRLALVAEVLENPTIIVEGWNRPDTGDCLVYVGKPDKDYRSAAIELPAPQGMLFAVFVLRDGTVDDWNWRPVSSNDPELPDGVTGVIVWPTQRTEF